MDIRFLVGPTRAQHEVTVPDGHAPPRVGDTVVLPAGDDRVRCAVKSVTWDYSTPGTVCVEVVAGLAAPDRVPSFATYGD